MRVWVSDGDPGQVLRVQYGYDDVPDRVWEIGGPDSMYPVTNDTPDWRDRWRELDMIPASKPDSVADGLELIRRHLIAQNPGIGEVVALELATMQACLGLLERLPYDGQSRATRWLMDRVSQDYSAHTSARAGGS